MNEILEQHRIQCAAILEGLLTARVFPLDDKLKPSLPEKDGLYVITRKDTSGGYEYLKAGCSTGKRKTGLSGLRGRICDDHLYGGASSDLPDLVLKNEYMRLGIPQGSTIKGQNRAKALTWISNNCFIQWVIEEDADLRCWAERYILSILRPIWGK